MLILRRRVGEAVLVGEQVEIEVLEAGAGRVKLGIRAPREIGILRKEIRLSAEQNLAAARGHSAESIDALVTKYFR